MLLLRHPELQSRLREDPALVPAFIAESLRLEGPTTVVPRRAITDIEFHGVRMRKDDLVNVCLLAANSDPTAFPSPGTIALDRPAGRDIAFGFGIHHCLGATVARHVAEILVDRLVRGLPSMRSAEPLDHLAYEQGNLRGLTRLRICVP
jgi:cytochrome P450